MSVATTSKPRQPIETIYVDGHRVACDGGGGALGHPKVWYEMGDDGEVADLKGHGLDGALGWSPPCGGGGAMHGFGARGKARFGAATDLRRDLLDIRVKTVAKTATS